MVGAACLLAGCDGGDLPGAPTIKYGTDQCAVCEMVINDQSCAAAVSVRIPKGREFRLFDDVAELFDYEQEDDALPVLERFVHDYPSKRWIKAEDATYVAGEKIRTPMLSGMVAFADAAAAKSFAEKNGARSMSIEEARLSRNAWRDARQSR